MAETAAQASLLHRPLGHRSVAPLAAWERPGEMLLQPAARKSPPSLLPRMLDKQDPAAELWRPRVGSASKPDAGDGDPGPRRVSWADHRSILADEVEARSSPPRSSRETLEFSRDERWKSSTEPDELALCSLFSNQDEDGGVTGRRETSGSSATTIPSRMQLEASSSGDRKLRLSSASENKMIRRTPAAQQRISGPDDRFMQCSCCSRKKEDRPASQLGIERELRVENSSRTSSLTTLAEKKPPMRFGANREESLKKVAALRSSKARFTVLPVITVSKNGRRRGLPWQGRGCSRRVPVLSRECSSSREGSTPPSTELAVPQLNSTARLLEKLEETKKEKFNLASARPGTCSHGRREQAAMSWKRPTSAKSDLTHHYENLCKISEPPACPSGRAARKQRTEATISVRRNKPSISDLWVPSEQCPQVCSTAPIKIEW